MLKFFHVQSLKRHWWIICIYTHMQTFLILCMFLLLDFDNLIFYSIQNSCYLLSLKHSLPTWISVFMSFGITFLIRKIYLFPHVVWGKYYLWKFRKSLLSIDLEQHFCCGKSKFRLLPPGAKGKTHLKGDQGIND